MTEQQKQKGFHKRRSSDQQRIESWKAIANYLQRSVRTVRRWESEEDLPVHRHKHSKGASVYAFRAELDAWRNVHRKALAPQSMSASRIPAPPETTRRPYLAVIAVVALVAAVCGVLVGKYAFVDDEQGYTEVQQSDALVIIAAPVIDESYPDVDEGLRQALRREVSSSYQVLPGDSVKSALRLMRHAPDTELNADLAKQVALRDGRVSAVLVPRAEQLGGEYLLSAEILDPHSGKVIAYPSERVSDPHAVLAAIENLAVDIRAALGQLPDIPNNDELPRVTTSSRSALHMYSRAILCLDGNRPSVALELLDMAVEQDPLFASAQILRAWALHQRGAGEDEYLRVSGEALRLSPYVTPAEQYFIEGSHHHLSGDLFAAEASYRALLEVEADHVLGAQALLEICLAAGNPKGCVNETVRLAEIQPDSFRFNLEAAWLLAASDGNAEIADTYVNRAQAFWRNDTRHYPPESTARMLLLPAYLAWTAGDTQLALQESHRLTDELPALPSEYRDSVIERLVDFSITLGRLDEAANLMERISVAEKRHELQAAILFASGNREQLRDYLVSDTRIGDESKALFMATSGLSEEAMKLHLNPPSGAMSTAAAAVVRARVAFSSGDVDSARSELHGAIEDLTLDDQAYYFVGLDTFAATLEADGQLNAAIRVLERTTPTRNDAILNDSGLYWLMCQRQLVRYYRRSDRDHEADLLENGIRQLLNQADEDFPLLATLEQV
jgi:hypothetical protein